MSKPRVVRHVDKKLSPVGTIDARRIFERGLVADHHGELAYGRIVDDPFPPRAEAAGPARQSRNSAEQADWHKWNTLGDRHEIMRGVGRPLRPTSRRVAR